MIQGIVEATSQTAAGLIVMTTDGRHGFIAARHGSHSERVLRQTTIPVLTIPDSALAGDYIP